MYEGEGQQSVEAVMTFPAAAVAVAVAVTVTVTVTVTAATAAERVVEGMIELVVMVSYGFINVLD